MIELTNTLLPNLPIELNWVYGIFYIIEGIAFFTLIIAPFYIIINMLRNKK